MVTVSQVRGSRDAAVLMVNDAAGLRAWQGPGRRQVLSQPGRARGGGLGRTDQQRPQAFWPEFIAGDSGVRGRDPVERVMQRRGGRLGQRRVGTADPAQLAHRPAAHLLRAGAQSAQPACALSRRHAQVRTVITTNYSCSISSCIERSITLITSPGLTALSS
jgi:hypothetical protein